MRIPSTGAFRQSLALAGVAGAAAVFLIMARPDAGIASEGGGGGGTSVFETIRQQNANRRRNARRHQVRRSRIWRARARRKKAQRRKIRRTKRVTRPAPRVYPAAPLAHTPPALAGGITSPHSEMPGGVSSGGGGEGVVEMTTRLGGGRPVPPQTGNRPGLRPLPRPPGPNQGKMFFMRQPVRPFILLPQGDDNGLASGAPAPAPAPMTIDPQVVAQAISHIGHTIAAPGKVAQAFTALSTGVSVTNVATSNNRQSFAQGYVSDVNEMLTTKGASASTGVASVPGGPPIPATTVLTSVIGDGLSKTGLKTFMETDIQAKTGISYGSLHAT